jgi:hypothetical protein
MKYVGAAFSAIGADFWGAILRVFIPALILGFIGDLVSVVFARMGGPYLAFILVQIPAVCVIALLVAESGGLDTGTLWEALRIVYPHAISLGIFLAIPKVGIEIALHNVGQEAMPLIIALKTAEMSLPVIALLLAVPLVQRQRGLSDALSAAWDRVARDFAGIAGALAFLIALSALVVGAGVAIAPVMRGFSIILAGLALAFVRVLAIYTFVEFFEYESSAARQASRREHDLSHLPSVWKPRRTETLEPLEDEEATKERDEK